MLHNDLARAIKALEQKKIKELKCSVLLVCMIYFHSVSQVLLYRFEFVCFVFLVGPFCGYFELHVAVMSFLF